METFFCILVPVVIIVVILIGMSQAGAAREKALAEARSAYQDALAALKATPTDPNLREAALAAGRRYSSATRENKGVTVFDEIALKNDLDAATAGAAAATPPAPLTSPAERLRQLDDLRQQGLITEDEYQARRTKILGDV
jgi:Short C-terminal domain